MKKNGNEIEDFEDIPFETSVLRGIYAYGFEKPSKIQRATLPKFTGRGKHVDLIVQSKCGTGKTAVYIVSMLNNLDSETDDLQGIVVLPSCELACQVFIVLSYMREYTRFKIHNVSNGTNIIHTGELLQKYKPQIIVGCVERLEHCVLEGYFDTTHLKMLVLDEVDSLLGHQMKQKTKNLLDKIITKDGVQMGAFSTSLPPKIVESAEKIMNNPHKILLKRIPENLSVVENHYSGIESMKNYGDPVPIGPLLNIFLFLDLSTVSITCSTTCKLFHRIIQSHHFWNEYWKCHKLKKSNESKSSGIEEKSIFNSKERFFIERHPDRILPPKHIRCFYINVPPSQNKLEVLLNLLESMKFGKVIVFFRTSERVDEYFRKLETKNGELSIFRITTKTDDRVDEIFDRFKIRGKVLLAPSGFGRGLDYYRINTVINFDVPEYCEDEESVQSSSFLRRAGLCGRYGRKGRYITLVQGEEDLRIKEAWERKYLRRLVECSVDDVGKCFD